MMDLAPLATVVGPMLLGLLLAFTQHFDAGAVDPEVQSLYCRCAPIVTERCFWRRLTVLKSARLPVQASQLEQPLRHAHRLAQGQVE